MSQRVLPLILLSSLLAACDGNPFATAEEETPTEEPEVPSDLPPELPGTTNPSANTPITRYEELDTETGNGYAENITYNPATDTFSVDNLAFDGDNIYRRGALVANLGANNEFQVYESLPVVNDPLTGNPIRQLPHRLLAGFSSSGETEFAIVRTGAYTDYGFGGFIMKRNADVSLPTTGQAGYTGAYAGIQDFSGASGLRYVSGTVRIAFDFDDFNDGDANYGFVEDRQVFDINGNNITSNVIASINAEFNEGGNPANNVTELPVLSFYIGPETVDANGEIRGLLDSNLVDFTGDQPTRVVFESGNYYGIIAGDNANEIVGIIVVESDTPGVDGITTRETGGFIVYR